MSSHEHAGRANDRRRDVEYLDLSARDGHLKHEKS
jgi:hypothetical protein